MRRSIADGRKTVDEIPITQLIAPAVKIDVAQKVIANPDYQVSVEDFTAWESPHGKIPDGCIVLLQTGYGQYWPDRVKYLGTDKRGPEGVAELHFPGRIPKRRSGWSITERSMPSASTPPASTMGSQRLSIAM